MLIPLTILGCGGGNPNAPAFKTVATELPAAEKEARRAQLKLTWNELEPNVPDDQNAAIDLDAPLRALERAKFDEAQFQAAMSRKQFAEAKALFGPRDAALSPVLATLTKPRFQVPRERRMQMVARLQLAVKSLDQRVRCMPGRPVADVLRDLEAQRRLTTFAFEGAVPDSLLVGVECSRIATETATAALGQNSSHEMLEAFRPSAIIPVVDWPTYVNGELMIALQAAEDPTAYPSAWTGEEARGLDQTLVRDAFRTRALQLYTMLVRTKETMFQPPGDKYRPGVAGLLIKPDDPTQALNRVLIQGPLWTETGSILRRQSIRARLFGQLLNVLDSRNANLIFRGGKVRYPDQSERLGIRIDWDDIYGRNPWGRERLEFDYYQEVGDYFRISTKLEGLEELSIEWPAPRLATNRRADAP